MGLFSPDLLPRLVRLLLGSDPPVALVLPTLFVAVLPAPPVKISADERAGGGEQSELCELSEYRAHAGTSSSHRQKRSPPIHTPHSELPSWMWPQRAQVSSIARRVPAVHVRISAAALSERTRA